MFELVKNEKKDYFNICIDGVTYLYSRVYYDKDEPEKSLDYDSNDKEVSQALINCKLSDFGDFIHISLGNVLNSVQFKHSISIGWDYESFGDYGKRKTKKTGKISLTFYFNPDLIEWKEIYSFFEYYREFEELLKSNEILKGRLRFYREDSSAFDISLLIENFRSSISNFLSSYVIEINKIHNQVVLRLLSKKSEDSLITTFNFPEELKISCEQYLSYFVRFLQDLGINAKHSFNQEAGEVLFSVTPTDDIEALDKIREALEIYLRLPSSQIISNSQEIAIQRLESQVEYFRSQIRLARAENQLKEATIQQQQVTIIKLSENVMIDSQVKDVTPAKSSKSEIFGGAIELGTPKKLEEYGIKKIDLDKLWKYLREKFAKKN
jgi:hypothetical protein